MQLQLKSIFKFSILLAFIAFLFSCSMSFEKRRYRPGYYVQVVQKHHLVKTNKINSESIKIDNNSREFILAPTNTPTVESGPLKKVDVTITHKFIKDKNKPINIKNKPQRSNKVINVHSQSKKINKVLDTKQSNIMPKRKIIAWILGGTAIFLFILALTFVIKFGTYGFVVPIWGIIEACLAIIALILAIIALVKGIKKVSESERKTAEAEKEYRDRLHKPVSAGFINTSFIFSTITVGIALVGFIFSFFLYPFGLIALILNIIVSICSIVSFSLGFRTLKDDQSNKTKLTIILGFIALILSIVGMILIFI